MSHAKCDVIPLAALLPHTALQPAPGRRLPSRLRRVLEWLSGYDLSDIRVHHRSPLPARLGAQAFACGNLIHLGPGAEALLAHEAWHVVQQKQGRSPVTAMVAGMALNDDPRLEAEADSVGQLARWLCRIGGWPGVPRSLLQQGIAQPLLQRAVTINGKRYTSEESSFLDLSKYVVAKLHEKLGDATTEAFPSSVMAEILVDFVRQDEVFADDAALLREVAIRNVGYRAESTMRKLMVHHNAMMAEAQQEMKKSIAHATAQWEEDQKAEYAERYYKDVFAYQEAVANMQEEGKKGFVQWGPASYFVSTKGSPMARWVLGQTDDEPLAMNCWETTMYALIKTGLVGRDYIVWANLTEKGQPPWRAVDDTNPVPQFLPQVVKIRDYYWSVDADPLTEHEDRRAQQHGWPTSRFVRLPQDVMIPRGRLVILNFGTHVALSTGKPYPISTERGKEVFGSGMGHGILELDSGSKIRSIMETTIEDLVSVNGGYLKHILCAPFPAIDKSYNVTIKEEILLENYQKLQDVIDAYMEANKRTIADEKSAKRKKDEQALQRQEARIKQIGDSKGVEDRVYQLTLQKAAEIRKMAITNQKQIDEKWQRSARKTPEALAILAEIPEAQRKRGVVKLPITFAYKKCDPYHGLVIFPSKK